MAIPACCLGFDIFGDNQKQTCCISCEDVLKKLQEVKNKLRTFIESEAWVIFVSMLMQDGPFAIVRLVCLFHWGITTYTNYFFTLKNILMLILQVGSSFQSKGISSFAKRAMNK